ncbi:MAG: HlyD family secretion protein [Planctomycetes bacterium]|nr:HlyD family secretion protein [Planctomycetota bacterium]
MTKPLPRPPRHLHVFGLSLMLIVGILVLFLFGVKMEATAPATGVATSTQIVTIRAPKSGFVRLKPSLTPGTFFDGSEETSLHRPESDMPIPVPRSSSRWMLLELPVADGQRVAEGDVLATLVPVEPESGNMLGTVIRLEIDEKNAGSVAPGQEVRLMSNMYHHRTHGMAKGIIDRLDPQGVAGPNGTRFFHAWVRVTENPFPLKLGSSFRAEIVTGKKPTFQIILEH